MGLGVKPVHEHGVGGLQQRRGGQDAVAAVPRGRAVGSNSVKQAPPSCVRLAAHGSRAGRQNALLET